MSPHVERPEHMELVRQVLDRSGVRDHLENIPARKATEDEIRLVHTKEMIETVRKGSSGDLAGVGPEARAGKGSWGRPCWR